MANFVTDSISGIGAWFKSAFDWIWNTFINPLWAVIAAVWYAITTVLDWVYDKCSSLATAARLVSDGGSSFFADGAAGVGWDLGSFVTMARVANTVMPLSELVSLTAAYLALVIILTSYKFIKSWIPKWIA